jgi:histidyl-tRNA synthetase
MKVTRIKGFSDILPGEVELWQSVEEAARQAFRRYNFAEIRIPVLEKTELFSRSIGETTDIVEKEMYTFEDRDPRSADGSGASQLTLRPEGTAGVIRAYIEADLFKIEPVRKLFYMGPMFRRERPQKGRMRQFHQIGAEALGRGDPMIDAEVLLLLHDFFEGLGLSEPTLHMNSLGCSECRPLYRERLLTFLRARQDALCANCRRRIERNPLRALDCKEPGCIEVTREAPSILESLCAACQDHFAAVGGMLRETGVPFSVDPRMVRGLDYYCRTTFEWTTALLGSQSAIAAGGRYDGLVQDLGGPAVPGVGFALGMERLTMLLRQQERPVAAGPAIYLAWMGEATRCDGKVWRWNWKANRAA